MSRLSPRAGGGGGSSSAGGYVPPPSIGHEIGVMFGGIGSMLLGSLLFWLWWNYMQKREDRLERERIDELRRSGLLDELKERSGSTDMGQKQGTEMKESVA